MIQYEKGSTLIIVLMIVLMITIIGTLAIRQSISSLKLVSNNQMQTLLLQNSDAALMAFQDPAFRPHITATNGIVGFFRNENHREAELVFCFSGAEPFQLSNASYRLNSSSFLNMATGGGACNNDSVSGGRSAVVTQVYIKRETDDVSVPFADLARGTESLGAKTENNIRLRVYVVSVMKGLLFDPNKTLFLGSTDIKQGCLTKSIDNDGTNEVADCLKNNEESLLYNMQVAEYRFLSDFEPSGS